MKKIKFFVTCLVVFAASALYAQNQQNKWLIGVDAHAVDHSSVDPIFNKFFKTKNWSIIPPFSKLTVGHSLTDHLTLDFTASVAEVNNSRAGWDDFKDEFLLKAGLGFRFYLFAKNYWFDPYLRMGVNYHKLDYNGKIYTISPGNTFTTPKKDFFLVDGGIGINLWITENFGLNLESNYNWVPSMKRDYANFFQHSAGVSFRFSKKDRDKDGIPDNRDECPDIPGLKQLNGCPDTDSDSIPDYKDKCPNVSGLKELDGCPDTDGDGIPDNLDACHKEKGPKENNGCPYKDTDGDDLLDKDDACPTVPGLKQFKGCPDTDGDGIPDNQDRCPKEKGGKENGGCPWDIKKEVENINLIFKDILFDFDRATIRPESLPIIKETAKRMIEIAPPNSKFYVDGYTDNIGGSAYNKSLSLKRAQSVKIELIKASVEGNRLVARYFGRENPKASNKTREGRQENRRVEIVIININEIL
ncbi:MAG: OmpA family protein [Flavobacteriales bacterium]